MAALHKALMHSYSVSGNDSVRLLLMTATPITESPMELVKIMNLCKPADQQLPDDFITFSDRYLNETGKFTSQGRSAFLDKIAGHISYLNREKDARQFAQVYIQYIRVPLIKDVQDAMNMDRKFIRSVHGEEINTLKSKIRAEIDKIDDDLKTVTTKQFVSLKEVCEQFDGRDNKNCIKIANAQIKELVKEAKEYTAQIKSDIKTIREEMKNKNLFKKEALSKMSEYVSENPEEMAEFKKSIYYMLKYKCGKRVRPDSKFKELSSIHPDIVAVNQELDAYDSRIGQLEQGLKSKVDAHNARIKRIKSMMRRSDTNDLERSVLKMTLADIRKTYKVTSKTGSKEAKEEIKDLSKTRKNIMRQKKKALSNLKKSMKKQLRAEKKTANATKKAEAKLRKIQRREEQMNGDFKNDVLKGLVNKYSKKIDSELENIM
jgi:DNA repair exonuclease SbcCD ATPase subunit